MKGPEVLLFANNKHLYLCISKMVTYLASSLGVAISEAVVGCSAVLNTGCVLNCTIGCACAGAGEAI